MINQLLKDLPRPSNEYFYHDKRVRLPEPIPRDAGVEATLAMLVANAGVQDGFKITLTGGNAAGGYETAVYTTIIRHATINVGDTYMIGNGRNKYFDKRGSWLKIRNDADKQLLIDIMTHPRDPRSVWLGTYGVTLGHVGTEGVTTSYSTTLDALL